MTDEPREHIEPMFMWESVGSAAEGFWPPLYLLNKQTTEMRLYKATDPHKGWSYESG